MITVIEQQEGEIGVPEMAKRLMAIREEATVESIAQLRESAANCNINDVMHNLLLVDSNLSGQIVLKGFAPEVETSINTWLRRMNQIISDSYRNALADAMFRMADRGCKCESKD